jgi:iron complex transport system ATP-binding protein
MKILNLKNATVFRGTNKVFDGFCLTVDQGQNTAIIGPNGCGKSTLLKLISRELYPAHSAGGVIEICGQSRWNVWELRNRLGLISADLQQRYLPHVSGLAVVVSGYFSSVGLYDHQQVGSQQIAFAEQVMDDLGVSHLRDRLFETFSTGEQRRCLLGRALVNQPEALIFDEPTAGLDLPAMFHYLQTLRRLMQAGTTIVLVTHHIHEIPPEIEHVVLLKAGRVMVAGDKAKMLTDQNLSALFEVPVKVVSSGGYFQALPATV